MTRRRRSDAGSVAARFRLARLERELHRDWTPEPTQLGPDDTGSPAWSFGLPGL